MNRRKALAVASTSAIALFSGGTAIAAGIGLVGRPQSLSPSVESVSDIRSSPSTQPGGVVTTIETVYIDEPAPIVDPSAPVAVEASLGDERGRGDRPGGVDGNPSTDDVFDAAADSERGPFVDSVPAPVPSDSASVPSAPAATFDDHGVDGPGHDVGDDHGVDGPSHDVGDDHGGDRDDAEDHDAEDHEDGDHEDENQKNKDHGGDDD